MSEDDKIRAWARRFGVVFLRPDQPPSPHIRRAYEDWRRWLRRLRFNCLIVWGPRPGLRC